MTKELTSCCSRQLSQRTEFVSSPSIYTVQTHGGAKSHEPIGDNRNLFLKLKTKLGLYHVEHKSKDSPEKITLTLVETQQLPDIGKSDSRDETSCLKWTIYNGRTKVCINCQTDTNKVNIVVYRYRNNTYLKDTEMDFNLTKYKKLLAKRVYLLSYIDVFYKRCIALDETTVHN